jgi:hypothetical protein
VACEEVLVDNTQENENASITCLQLLRYDEVESVRLLGRLAMYYQYYQALLERSAH